MKVITLSQKKLEALTDRLLSMIVKDNVQFDMIIGIASGGTYISQPMHKKLQKEHSSVDYYEIKLTRESTQTKKKLNVQTLLTKLPYFILNLLRKLEMFFHEFTKKEAYNNQKEDLVKLSEERIENIKNIRTVLLIDDAIDTGSTLLAIRNALQRINPNLVIKTAVLTVTHKEPYIQPDYTLYRQVLLRCPWAMDYKGDDKIE